MNTITVLKRDMTLKPNQLRRAGFVPGSICGSALPESVSIQMDAAAADKLARSARVGSKLNVLLDGKTISVQLKDKTLDILKHDVRHIVFQALSADKKIKSVIDIVLLNEDKVAGVLEKMLLEIPYSALPDDMIDTVSVDLDGLAVGTILTVADITELQNEKIELHIDEDSMVLRISDKKRAAKQEDEPAEA